MALPAYDILDAYRADLDQAHTQAFSTCDSTWIVIGTILQRAAGMSADDRAAYVSQAWPPLETTSVSRSSLFEAIRDAATSAENCGAFAVSMVLLDYGRSVIDPHRTTIQGRLLYQQARVLRKVGELDRADMILQELLDMGDASSDDSLVAWAHVGLGANARVRGNHPRAREAFRAALRYDVTDVDGTEVHSHAHHGLLVASAAAQDFDAALVHGLGALKLTNEPSRRVEMLVNLAAVCYDVGEYQAALVGYLRVLSLEPGIRLYVNALGGAALSAARKADTRAVRELAKQGDQLLLRDNPAHDLADMAREFAEAFDLISEPDEYQRFRSEAFTRAKRGGFFEVLHRLEELEHAGATARGVAEGMGLSNEARSAAAELATGDADELLLVAVSSGLPE